MRLDTEIENSKTDILNVTAFLSRDRRSITGTDKTTLHGVAFSNQTFFVFVGTWFESRNLSIAVDWCRQFFISKTKKSSFEHKKHIFEFIREYPDRHVALHLFTMSFEINETHSRLSHMSLPYELKGITFEGKTVKHYVNGTEFDHIKYSKNIRIGLVVFGFCMMPYIVHRYSNRLAFTTTLWYLHISNMVYSILFHRIMCPIADTLHEFRGREMFSVSYMVYEMILCIYILTRSLYNNRMRERMLRQVPLFVLVALRISFFATPRKLHWLLLNTLWIPQIVWNAVNLQNGGIPMQLVTWVTAGRTIYTWYCESSELSTLFDRNEANSRAVGLWLMVQYIVLWLQYFIGPVFFLPRVLKQKLFHTFDYQASVPDAGEVCAVCYCEIGSGTDYAVTPCKHVFHMTCLRRWVEQKQDCPMCRNPLPKRSDEI